MDYHQEYQSASEAYIEQNYSQAAAILERMVEQFPEDPHVRLLWAHTLCYGLQSYDRATTEYQVVLGLTTSRDMVRQTRSGLAHIQDMLAEARLVTAPEKRAQALTAGPSSSSVEPPSSNFLTHFLNNSLSISLENLNRLAQQIDRPAPPTIQPAAPSVVGSEEQLVHEPDLLEDLRLNGLTLGEVDAALVSSEVDAVPAQDELWAAITELEQLIDAPERAAAPSPVPQAPLLGTDYTPLPHPKRSPISATTTLADRPFELFDPFESTPAATISAPSDALQITLEHLSTLDRHTAPVTSLVFLPDNETLVSSGGDSCIKVWHWRSQAETHNLTEHIEWITSLALSSDGQCLLSASFDKTLLVWNVADFTSVRGLAGHEEGINSVTIAGTIAASGSRDKTIKLWDLDRGWEIRTLKGHTANINTVVLFPDGKRLVSGSQDKTIRFWDVQSGQELRNLSGHQLQVTTLAASQITGQVVSGSGDKTLKVWDWHSGQLLQTLSGHTSYISALALDADGDLLVSGSGNGELKVWQLSQGREVCGIQAHDKAITAIALSPDRHSIATGCYDESIKVWGIQ